MKSVENAKFDYVIADYAGSNRLYQIDWKSHQVFNFKPSNTSDRIMASESNGHFVFRTTGRVEFDWVGNLKPQFANAIMSDYNKQRTRLGLEQSEWFRLRVP